MTVLVTWLIVAVVVVAVASTVVFRRRSHDDEHSVSDYHRQLHTLEVLRAHPSEAGKEGEPGGAFPDTAFRVTSSSSTTVRLTEPGKPAIPPVPPPPVPDPSKPVTFDDAGPVNSTPAAGHGTPWLEDRAMHGINRRPRRMAAPAVAVVVVSAVIVVLLVTGSHPPPPHHNTATSHQSTGTTQHTTGTTQHTTGTSHHVTTTSVTHRVTTAGGTTTPHHHRGSTTTTTIPVVSLPHAGSDHTAVYAVKPSSYSLAMSATTAECWVEATEAGSGTVLYTGVLAPGQTKTVQATGGVSVVVGAPNSFAANIDGTSVSFPFGYQAPFTMQFLVASS